MKQLQGAIIGCGVIAPNHLASYLNLNGVGVKTLCDIELPKAQKLAEKFDIPNTAIDFRTVLADDEIDFISVCTDHASHGEIALAALAAGKHVLCEKALDCSYETLAKMAAAAEVYPDLVMSGIFQHRYEKYNILLKKLLDEGAFGRIVMANLSVSAKRTNEYYRNDPWRGTLDREGGGVLINQAIHYLDLLRYFCGEADELCARCENIGHVGVIEVEDTATLNVIFRSGTQAAISASTATAEPWHCTLGIFGDKGSIEMSNGSLQYLYLADKDQEPHIRLKFEAALATEPLKEGQKAYYGGGHMCQIADFIAAIRSGKGGGTLSDWRSASSTAKLVLNAYKSSSERAWVKC